MSMNLNYVGNANSTTITILQRGYGVVGWMDGERVKVFGLDDWVMTMVVVNAFFRLFLISNG